MSLTAESPTPLIRYAGRRVLITGAGSGIGQACVLRILAEGGQVAAADISADGLADTATKAGDLAGQLSTVTMDVGDEASVRAGVAEAVRTLGGLDTLVNAAGILRSSHLTQTTLADFELVLRINLVGTFLVTREAIGALKEGNHPAVVNFSSTSASFAHPYMAAYAASKGGVLSMTHAWASEFAKAGIRFNSVQPGSISSGMTDGTGESRQSVGPGLPEDADFSLFGKVAPMLPLEGGAIFAKPDAVAAAVAMLGSDDAYFITGTEVRIDGGSHMQWRYHQRRTEMKNAMLWCALSAMGCTGLLAAPPVHSEPFFANYQLIIPDRFDFHTWTWAVTHCLPADHSCVQINAIPMPVAKAFQYTGDAHLVDGRYTLAIDVPDGLRCGNVYYGPVIATHDVYSWDAVTLQGTLTSSFAAGCDGAPGGAVTYPFSLVRL